MAKKKSNSLNSGTSCMRCCGVDVENILSISNVDKWQIIVLQIAHHGYIFSHKPLMSSVWRSGFVSSEPHFFSLCDRHFMPHSVPCQLRSAFHHRATETLLSEVPPMSLSLKPMGSVSFLYVEFIRVAFSLPPTFYVFPFHHF